MLYQHDFRTLLYSYTCHVCFKFLDITCYLPINTHGERVQYTCDLWDNFDLAICLKNQNRTLQGITYPKRRFYLQKGKSLLTRTKMRDTQYANNHCSSFVVEFKKMCLTEVNIDLIFVYVWLTDQWKKRIPY